MTLLEFLEISDCILDLNYEDKQFRFKYPQGTPHIMPLFGPFTRDKNVIVLTVLVQAGRKYRKVAKAEINLYRKYFLTEKLYVEKWVYLNLYQTQLEQMAHNTNILSAISNMGKIYMKAQLLDPVLEEDNKISRNAFDKISIYSATTHASAMNQILKNNLKTLLSTKDKAYANKTERFRSVTENENEFLKKLRKGQIVIGEDIYEDIEEENDKEKPIEFADGLSDISISFIDGAEDNHVEITTMNVEIDAIISNLRVLFEENADNILPSDPEKLKEFIFNMTGSVKTISDSYLKNLQALDGINKRLKLEGKDYYEKYKAIKRTFKGERLELSEKNKNLEMELINNTTENKKVASELEEVQNELEFLKAKIGISKEPIDDELMSMIDILNCLKDSVDIGSILKEDEREQLNEILDKYNKNEDNASVDYEEIDDERIINQIEEIVNLNFQKGNISNIKIDQVSADTYTFNDKTCTLYFDDETLKVRGNNDVTFGEWVLSNFGIISDEPGKEMAASRKENEPSELSANKNPSSNKQVSSVNSKATSAKKVTSNASANKNGKPGTKKFEDKRPTSNLAKGNKFTSSNGYKK